MCRSSGSGDSPPRIPGRRRKAVFGRRKATGQKLAAWRKGSRVEPGGRIRLIRRVFGISNSVRAIVLASCIPGFLQVTRTALRHSRAPQYRFHTTRQSAANVYTATPTSLQHCVETNVIPGVYAVLYKRTVHELTGGKRLKLTDGELQQSDVLGDRQVQYLVGAMLPCSQPMLPRPRGRGLQSLGYSGPAAAGTGPAPAWFPCRPARTCGLRHVGGLMGAGCDAERQP
jgi:hypothetical protein